jgi:hypothetical protein
MDKMSKGGPTMLIFSQNKGKIVNTKNIIGLSVDVEPYTTLCSISPPYAGTDYTIVAICDRNQITIGRYDTRERAEEILKQLYYMYSEELKANYETTFEMPEE